MQEQTLTIKTAIVAIFSIVTPLSGLLTFYVSTCDNALEDKFKLKMMEVVNYQKENRARIIREEDQTLKSNENSAKLVELLTDIKAALKYRFVTKEEMKEELLKKVDMNRIDKRTLKD